MWRLALLGVLIFLVTGGYAPLGFDPAAAAAGLVGDQLTLARGVHDLFASGACTALAAMIPEFRGVPQANGDFVFGFAQIYWLCCYLLSGVRRQRGFFWSSTSSRR